MEKAISYDKLSVLCEREDDKGNKVPFSMVYVAKSDGRVIRKDKVVTTSVDHVKRTRTVEYEEGGKMVQRTLRDCLIVEVNGVRVIG